MFYAKTLLQIDSYESVYAWLGYILLTNLFKKSLSGSVLYTIILHYDFRQFSYVITAIAEVTVWGDYRAFNETYLEYIP